MLASVCTWTVQNCSAEPPGVNCIPHSVTISWHLSDDTLSHTHSFFSCFNSWVAISWLLWLQIVDTGFIVRFLFLFVIFSHELISHSGVKSTSKWEPSTKHFYILLPFPSYALSDRVVNIRKWKCSASSPFPSPLPSHFLSFRGEEPSTISHQDCLQSNICSQLLGSETESTFWIGDGWLVSLCSLYHGCHSFNGLFILCRQLCLVVIILANLYWVLAVCQAQFWELYMLHPLNPCYKPVK